MDIKKMKLEDLLKISSMFNQESNQESNQNNQSKNIYDRYIGKYVICRTRNEGINAGYVVELDDTGVILKYARRLYYHRPSNKSASWYEGVAKFGISEDSKVGTPVEKIIVEDYSLTICTAEAEESIKKAKENEQS